MRRLLSLLLIFAVATTTVSVMAKSKKEEPVTFTVEGAGSSQGGKAIVKVTVITKKKENVDNALLGELAVKGVLFRGYSNASGYGTVNSVPPLCGSASAEVEHAEFFVPFFAGGDYMAYVSCLSDSRRVVKVGKEYKVSCEVAVEAGRLNKFLGEKGIIDNDWGI